MGVEGCSRDIFAIRHATIRIVGSTSHHCSHFKSCDFLIHELTSLVDLLSWFLPLSIFFARRQHVLSNYGEICRMSLRLPQAFGRPMPAIWAARTHNNGENCPSGIHMSQARGTATNRNFYPRRLPSSRGPTLARLGLLERWQSFRIWPAMKQSPCNFHRDFSGDI